MKEICIAILVAALLAVTALFWHVVRRKREKRKLLAALQAPPPGILLDVLAVKGFRYVPQRDALLPLLRDGEPVTLRREPDNPHDCKAVRLLRADGRAIGYLPMKYNAIPAALLDEGEALCGRLRLPGGDGAVWRMEVELYWRGGGA